MAKLTEDMVFARTKTSELSTVKKLNCWGSDLTDVSLVRRLTNVEVLSLSLNKISTLMDFQYCRGLCELYVRRNEIRDLSELCYLQELPRLRILLLTENPCVDTAGNLYRLTVLRCLPNLEVLDNQPVEPEEVELAMRSGLILEHPLNRKERSSPEPVYYVGGSGSSEGDREPLQPQPPLIPSSRNRRGSSQYEYDDEPVISYRNPNTIRASPIAEYPWGTHNAAPSRVNGEEEALPQVQNTLNLSETPPIAKIEPITTTNDPCPTPPTTNSVSNGPDTPNPSIQVPSSNGNFPEKSNFKTSSSNSSNSPTNLNDGLSNHGSPEYYPGSGMNGQRRSNSPEYGYEYGNDGSISSQRPSTVPAHPRPGSQSSTRLKRSKSSNIVSAVLCLIPELDLNSLEVLEMAIRRRMEEISINEQ